MTSVHARAELAMPALLVVIGVVSLVGGLGYGMTDDGGRVGTGFLPAIAGGALAALAVVDVIATRRRQTAAAQPAPRSADDAESARDASNPEAAVEDPDGRDIHGRTDSQRVRSLVAVAVLVIVAVALVPVVGFLLSFAALMLAITMGVERMSVPGSIITTAVAVAVIWGVFVQFLLVPLPQGMLGMI